MSLIGIITNQKNEIYMRKELVKNSIADNIIFINDKNIINMKNIKFDIMVIDSILNMDMEIDIDNINDLSLKIITYGFNSKSTFSVSSVTESDIIICLQRTIYDITNKKIEPQEYQLKNYENIDIHAIIASKIVNVLNSK